MDVHISQFYPCSKVDLACELYYICELGKYSKLNFDRAVSLDGVILSTILKKSKIWDYFRVCVANGWLVKTGVSEEELQINAQTPIHYEVNDIINLHIMDEEVSFDYEENKLRRADPMYDLMTPIKSQVSFEEKNNEFWLWSIGGKDNSYFNCNNSTLNRNRADQAWLSLIAMVAVNRLFTGYPNRLMLKFSNNVILNNMALSYLMILEDKTTCLYGWLYYTFDETVSVHTKLQLGYTAWYAIGRDQDYLNRWFSAKEKFDELKRLDMQVGDLVVFYERDKAQRINYVKSIASCHIAKITSMTDDEIGFELINTTRPYYDGKLHFDDHSTIVKKMFMDKPYYKELQVSPKSLALTELGVGYMLYTEKFFIVPLSQADDSKVVNVSNGSRSDCLVLDQNNLIYWILKDYHYDFNEEHFLQKYFSDHEPLYTRYMRGDEIEEYWYYVAED